MADISLTIFDMAVLFVVVISVLLALMRGLIREALAVLVWFGSIAVALATFGSIRPLLDEHFPAGWIGDAITLALVFTVPLAGLKVVAGLIANVLPLGIFGSFDRLLGAGFGFVRGGLLVSIAYLGLVFAIDPKDHPGWVQNAILLPYVQDGASLLAGWMPEDIVASASWPGLTGVDLASDRSFGEGLTKSLFRRQQGVTSD